MTKIKSACPLIPRVAFSLPMLFPKPRGSAASPAHFLLVSALFLLLAATTSVRAQTPASAIAPDARTGLKAGLYDAGVAALNVDLVVSIPSPPGFYEAGAADGSRPGTVYLNLSSMKVLPLYELEDLLYHEGIPGHHMQISTILVDRSIPQLRKVNEWWQDSAFVEGWGLYAERLGKDGLSVAAIHGNKSQGARTKALDDFKRGKIQVLVATDIAARGLDISELPHVVNFELPHVPEDYIHRIGRTGRAGSSGEAISLVSRDERDRLGAIERLLGRPISVAA